MCNLKQCSRCRLDYESCGHYDPINKDLCKNYVFPINNSKMFGRWYKFSGRIGRLEYTLTLIIAIVFYYFLIFLVGQMLRLLDVSLEANTSLLVLYACMIPSIYLIMAAGLKRVHDSHQKWYYATAPLLVLFLLNIFTIVIAIAGFLYLFVATGEDGINEYGSNPVQPYSKQIRLDC